METKNKIVSHRYVNTPSGVGCVCGKNWCPEAEAEIRKAERETPRVTENEHGIQIVLKGKLSDDGEIRIVRRFGDRKIFLEANKTVMGEKRNRFNYIEYDLTKEELEVLQKGIEKILASFKPVPAKGDAPQQDCHGLL